MSPLSVPGMPRATDAEQEQSNVQYTASQWRYVGTYRLKAGRVVSQLLYVCRTTDDTVWRHNLQW